MPVGTIAMWSDLNGAVPAGWAVCDGTANAPGPDLRDSFVLGWGVRAVDTMGGAATHAHADELAHAGGSVLSGGGHVHAGSPTENARSGGGATPALGGHTHDVIADHGHGSTQPSAHGAHAGTNHEPPFYALKFIQRMS